MKKFSHTDESGKARMVDVGDKPVQKRSATARGFIRLRPGTLALISENQIKKGDVLTVAELAGIQAAKQTAALIPLCHPLPITRVEVQTRVAGPGRDQPQGDIPADGMDESFCGIIVTSTVKCNGQTGVEMEALAAVSVALLTIYDMCKAVDKEMVIGGISLVEKTKQ